MVKIIKPEDQTAATEAGKVIEPKLKEYAESVINHKYLAVDPSEIHFDAFRDNQIFGGLPDAEPCNEQGEIIYEDQTPMLEIKTTSEDSLKWSRNADGELKLETDADGVPLIKSKGTRKAEWFNAETGEYTNIPVHYQYQLALYLWLRHHNKGAFVAGFLQPKDYVKPEEFVPNDDNVIIAQMEVDLDWFQNEVVTYCKKWYEDHIVNGISPEMTREDAAWFELHKQEFEEDIPVEIEIPNHIEAINKKYIKVSKVDRS